MILVDTHTLLWWKTGDRRLSSAARKAISQARRVHVSPLSFWEIAVLVQRHRIKLTASLFEWIRTVVNDEQVEIAALSPTAAASAGLLGSSFRGDLADRFLYATARELGVPFVTKDDAIRDYARVSRDVRTIW